MKSITMLLSILGLSFYTASAIAESYLDVESYFGYEEVPVLGPEQARIAPQDFVIYEEDFTVYEQTPTYEGKVLEEGEFAAFEEIGISHE